MYSLSCRFCLSGFSFWLLALSTQAEANELEFSSVRHLRAGQSPYMCALADLRHTGALDVIVINNVSDDLQWHQNDGRGVFNFGGSFKTGGKTPNSCIIADLDGDSWEDVVV